jgi:hypothetical protein
MPDPAAPGSLPLSFPALAVAVMYMAAGFFLIAPLISSTPQHATAMRRRAAGVWFMSSAGLVYLYLVNSPDVEKLAVYIIGNVAVMLAAFVLRRIFNPPKPGP